MRLDVLDHGHRLRARLFLWLARRMSGEEADDVFKTVLYRPELYGGPALPRLVREALRGPSMWTEGERELLAAAASQANRCAFCADIHSRTASLTTGMDVTPDVLAHGPPEGSRPEVVAMLGLIEKLAIEPELVRPEDVEPVRSAGVSDDGISDALAVLFVFNVLNRFADAFAYGWDSDRHREKGAEALVRYGYKLPTFFAT